MIGMMGWLLGFWLRVRGWGIYMDGQDGWDVGLVVFGAFLACAGGFETRPYVAFRSLCEGEEGVLVWPAGVLQVLVGWLVGVVCPLCPSDISPASGGNPSGSRTLSLLTGQAEWFVIAALAGIGRGPVL